MSYEFLSAAASVGTFVVIAATAVAALIQLQHLRASNQISAVLSLFAQTESAEMQQRFAFVRNELPVKMKDPAFRAGYSTTPIDRTKHPEMFVLDYYDQPGRFLQLRLVDENVVLMQEVFRVTAFWDLLEPSLAIMRRDGIPFYIGFEYLVSRARAFSEGTTLLRLSRFPRIPIKDAWLTVDQRDVSARINSTGGSKPGF